jgi:hypothetical protein
MKEYKINVDVFCYKSDTDEKKDYRLYVDDDLITERSYVWRNRRTPQESGQFVRENIWVNLAPGEHEVRIESLDPNFIGFILQNILVDNEPAQMTSKTRFVIS